MKIFLRACIFLMIASLLVSCNWQPIQQSFENDKQQSTKPLHILILGIDTRGEEHSRSDAIIVGQYHPQQKSLKLVSLMRDTYVKIPSYKKEYNKLNTAYYLGGQELMVKTIKENFGLDVDHVITIDFKGFVQVVDTIAPEGIEVEVTQDMVEDMNFAVEPGMRKLHGEELLKYVRFRHDAESDFGRVKRQQEVIVKVREQLSEQILSVQQFADLPKLVENITQYVESDLTMPEMLALAAKVFFYQIDEIETMTIPVENGFENKTYEHAGAVLQLDYQKNVEALNNFFNKPKAVNN